MIAKDSTVASLSGVTRRYGPRMALDDVSLNIQAGQVTALLGPNGAGKSTVVALLLGLQRPDAGRVALFGDSPAKVTTRQQVGVMLQAAALPDMLRVSELLTLTASYYPRPSTVEQVAELVGIGDLLGRFYGQLSGGQQRSVQFALAVCGNPRLLFLDEPTTGLDFEAREQLWSVVRAQVARGCAVLLTTHYLEEAEALAQAVIVLKRGRVVLAQNAGEINIRQALSREVA